jgi:hypothetical protein
LPDPLHLGTPTASDGSVEDEVEGEVEVEVGPDQEETIQQEVDQEEINQEGIIQEDAPPRFLRPRTTWAKNEHPYELKYTGMVRRRPQCPRTDSGRPRRLPSW